MFSADHVLLDARHVSSEELSVSGTLDVVEGGADHTCVVHLLLGLTPPLENETQVNKG